MLLLLLAAGQLLVFGQEAGKIFDLKPAQTGIRDVSISPGSIRFRFELSGLRADAVQSTGGRFTRLNINGFSSLSGTGTPELPGISKLIEIPPGTLPEIKIITKAGKKILLDSVELPAKLFPRQPPLAKMKNKDKPEFKYKKELYLKDTIFNKEIVSIRKLGIMRGRQLALLNISPVQYNPVKNEITTYPYIDIEVIFKETGKSTSSSVLKYLSVPFEDNFKTSLNYLAGSNKNESKKPLKYVILSDTMFKKTLKPFIEWKTRKGFEIIELYKGENGIGNTADEMKNYLKNLYHSSTADDPAFTYLLIVGDHEQIPGFWLNGHISDLPYAEYDGKGDFIPDVYYGRFSAQDTAQLIPQLEKTLEYEQYLFPDPSFLDKAVMIAGYDGGGNDMVQGNGQINYGTDNYFNPSHGITSHTFLSKASASQDSLIREKISEGACFVNYTGHGSWDRWQDPTFAIAHIPDMENANKYPLMIGNGCVTSVFNINECFGEALLRARNKGALGYIGCTDDSYWDEDFWWAVGTGTPTASPDYESTGQAMYDLCFHDHGEAGERWAQTMSEFIFAGNMAVAEGNYNMAEYYWEIYQLMGDPSLMVYFSVPDTIIADNAVMLPPGSKKLQFITRAGLYTGLSRDNCLLAAGYSNEEGLVDLNFDEISPGEQLWLVISGQNMKPHIAGIQVAQSTETYITVDTMIINDYTGNNNGQADHGEEISFDLKLNNLGLNTGININTIISCNHKDVEIIDSVASWGNIEAAGSSSLTGLFKVILPDSIQDLENIVFSLKIYEGSEFKRKEYFQINVAAPMLEFGRTFIIDTEKGNGNSHLDPGEEAMLCIELFNSGHSEANEISAVISCSDSSVQLLTDSVFIQSVPASNYEILCFNLEAIANAIPDSSIKFELRVSSVPYSVILEFRKIIGHPELIYEDFESGDFNNFNWIMAENYPWTISNENSYQGEYSAQSGYISHNQSTSLSYEYYYYEPDTISFWFRVSSEHNYDYLNFYIDTLTGRWSGNLDWQYVEFPVGEGQHLIKWTYSKDGNTSYYEDHAWIDFINFPPTMFSKQNIGLQDILDPVQKEDYSDSEIVRLKIKNFGIDTVCVFTAGFSINGGPLILDTIYYDLLPGSSYLHTFPQSIDMSDYSIYQAIFFTSLDNDPDPRNDTIKISFNHINTAAGYPAENNSDLRLYPNPFKNILYLQDNDISCNKLIINIFNITGKKVFQKEFVNPASGEIIKLDLPDLDKGLYIINVNKDGLSSRYKIVCQ